ncbi:unnamed protein product [Mytilus coruscus]|uniref:CARD domain-containing protein n=1 Tax=Mytilus coruscus TaxID=42192 RepID=A0A6J8DQE8_MYTCO|nr:unnamed protein product [Mytilus coruscus]
MEWNRKIEDKLTENWQWLMKTVMLKEIVHVLIEDKVIALDFWMNLKEKQISEQDRNANFFFEVSKFTKERYRMFVDALRKGGHSHLADMLEIKPQDLRVNKTPTALGPKNERIKKENIPKNSKSKPPPEHISKHDRTPSDIKRENSELRNQLTTISSHVGHLHSVTQNITGSLVSHSKTFVAEKESFVQRIQNIEEHEKYLELQDTNLKREMVIKHLRSEIVDLKVDLNHQINQLEIKLKDANVKRELKQQEAENLLSKITGLKTQMQSLTKDLNLEREEKIKLKIESTKLRKQNSELQEKIRQQTSKVVSLENDMLQVKSEKESAKSEFKLLEKKMSETEKVLKDKTQKNDELSRDIIDAKCKAEEFEQEKKRLENKVSNFEKEIVDLKAKLHKLEADKQRARMKSSVVPTWR